MHRALILATVLGGSWLVMDVARAQTIERDLGGIVTAPGLAGPSRAMDLPLDKSTIISLPRETRDVLVTNPAIADVVVKTRRRVYLMGKGVGQTDVYFFDGRGEQILRLDLRVSLDLTALRAALADVLPNEAIKARSNGKMIILTGKASSAAAAENARRMARRFAAADADVINMVEIVGGEQVLLQVHISEMQRTIVKQLGINTTFGNSHSTFTVIPRRGTQTDTFSSVFFDFASIFGLRGTFSSLIDALEREGVVKTLAQPNLTAISGETAKFLVGGEFPIPVAAEDNKITIEFKEFGVLLTFTPVVLSAGRISLRMSTEVSRVTFDNQIILANTSIPSLSIRRAETTVEIPSGGSLVIAGLLQNDNENTIDGLPFLKDIPILGALFRSVGFARGETELVITVSPIIVRPIAEGRIALPTDGFAPASDADLYLLGRLHGVYARPGKPAPRAQLKGPIGHILE